MTYAVSDLHGCYDLFVSLLNRINFRDTDMMYILGDAVDRGAQPIRLMTDIMSRKNVIFIKGRLADSCGGQAILGRGSPRTDL